MKFDAARASQVFDTLGDSAFAGPSSEDRIADFLVGELRQMGWTVERSEVQGSRFPQQAATWIGWLVYGSFMTAAYFMIYVPRSRVIFVLGLLALGLGHVWFVALSLNRIRWGRDWKPIERAPVVVARRLTDTSAPVRVVFQAALGGHKADCFSSFGLNRLLTMVMLDWSLVVTILIGFVAAVTIHQLYVSFILCFGAGLLALTWLAIFCSLGWDFRQSRNADRTGWADRHSLAVLLSLARTWPRSRSSQIEPIFVAAGGQTLNYAGSREVIRLLESEWPRKPSLLLLLAAVGAGREHDLFEVVPRSLESRDLARKVAESLWIPLRRRDPWSYLQVWPFEQRFRADPRIKTVEVFALMGSISAADSDSSIEPNVLEQAWQLATELVLRWVKMQRDESVPADVSREPDFSNKRGNESA